MTLPLCGDCHGVIHSKGMTACSELTRKALAAKKVNGEVYNHCVFGFDKRAGRLAKNKAELEEVRRIHELHHDGLTLRDIANDLNDRGIIGKRGGVFYASTIQAILRNDIYALLTPESVLGKQPSDNKQLDFPFGEPSLRDQKDAEINAIKTGPLL